jgi:spore coat protein U-like protein
MTDFRLLSLCVFCFSLLGAHEHLRAEASKVTIGLQGRIAPKCSLSDMTGKLDFGSVDGTGRASRSAAVDFTIDCNTPFIYRLSAQEGAMRLQGSVPAPSAAHMRLPYDISLIIPTDDGGTLRRDCNRDMLKAGTVQGCLADSGSAVAILQRGQMAVSLLPTSEKVPQGEYTDNIQITLSVK